jgi:hypothetical protein
MIGTVREELRVRLEEVLKAPKDLRLEGHKSYVYRYPGTKIELDLMFSDYRLAYTDF